MTVTVEVSCSGCGACLITCPAAALRPAPHRPRVVDALCTDCLACLEVCPVDAIRPVPPPEGVHPIEAESYRVMAESVDLSGWAGGAREVVARMVHATADDSFAATARIGWRAVDAAVAALGEGAPVVCDTHMVVAGLSGPLAARCFLDQVPEAPAGSTRSAAAMAAAAGAFPVGAVWVIGNAPTALATLVELHRRGAVEPAAVVGLPVGYVGAAGAKADLWAGPLGEISITNTGRRGGSPAAAAAVNALSRLARR